MRIQNRADGVDGHYCIAKHNEGGFSEFWTEHCNSFTSAGTVYIGEKTAITKLEELMRSCDNCNQVYEREYSNGGKQCFGLVKDTFRDCDVIRACQKYDNGKMFLQDLSPDEAAEMATGYSAAIRTWFSFFYQRPCGTCEQKQSDCNVAE
jgi:hypothetical protein